MRAMPSFTSRSGPDLLDIELVEVGRFDLAEEDVLDFGGAERGVGGHNSEFGLRSFSSL